MKANRLLSILQDRIDDCNSHKSLATNFIQITWRFFSICCLIVTIPFFLIIEFYNFTRVKVDN